MGTPVKTQQASTCLQFTMMKLSSKKRQLRRQQPRRQLRLRRRRKIQKKRPKNKVLQITIKESGVRISNPKQDGDLMSIQLSVASVASWADWKAASPLQVANPPYLH